MKIRETKKIVLPGTVEKNVKWEMTQLMIKAVSLYWKIYMNIHHPAQGGNKKYSVSIAAIFKNEAPYLKEWIEYHKIAGVDHFYLYNNESEDDYMEVLNSYIEDGTVTLIDWPYKQKQLESYCDCIKRFKDETRWLGFIDIDEFVVPIQDNDIYSFLKKYESNRPAVLLYWKIFGTGGLIDRNIEEPVTDSFHICWDKLYAVGKCFYNTSYDFDPGFFRNSIFHHHMWGQYNGKNLPPVNAYGKVSINQYSNPMKNEAIPIQINHYFTKSLSEYAEKKSKGDVFFKENPHDQEYMMAHENRCTSSDYSIYKYEMKLKDVLKKQHEKTFN